MYDPGLLASWYRRRYGSVLCKVGRPIRSTADLRSSTCALSRSRSQEKGRTEVSDRRCDDEGAGIHGEIARHAVQQKPECYIC